MAPIINIKKEEIQEFHENGAVCLRNVFDQEWVNKSAVGITKNVQNPSKYRYRILLPIAWKWDINLPNLLFF